MNRDCFDCYRLAPDHCDRHYRPPTDYYDDDYGPADSNDGPDRDEYEPGGRYFEQEDTPSLSDHPMYHHVHNRNPYGMDGGY